MGQGAGQGQQKGRLIRAKKSGAYHSPWKTSLCCVLAPSGGGCRRLVIVGVAWWLLVLQLLPVQSLHRLLICISAAATTAAKQAASSAATTINVRSLWRRQKFKGALFLFSLVLVSVVASKKRQSVAQNKAAPTAPLQNQFEYKYGQRHDFGAFAVRGSRPSASGSQCQSLGPSSSSPAPHSIAALKPPTGRSRRPETPSSGPRRHRPPTRRKTGKRGQDPAGFQAISACRRFVQTPP